MFRIHRTSLVLLPLLVFVCARVRVCACARVRVRSCARVLVCSCARVLGCSGARVRARVRACARARVRACLCLCVCMFVCLYVYMLVCLRVFLSVCVWREAHMSKDSPSHLKPLSRPPSFGGTHVQASTVTSQTSLKTAVVWWHTCPGIHRHISNLSLKTTVVWWHTRPRIHRHISNLSQDHRRLVAHMSKDSPSHLKPLSRSPSFGGTHVQGFTVTSQTSLKPTVVWWHTRPRIHRHISNLSQDHRRLVAHMSKDSPSHLKPLSRPPSLGGTHIQALTVTSQTSLKTTVVWWHSYPSIHRHISNLSQDHRRLVAHISKHSPSHLNSLSRPPSFGGTHVQGFTVTSQTSLKTTVVWWHTYPIIHRHIATLSQHHRRFVAHMSKHSPSNLSQDHRRLVAHMSKHSPSHLNSLSRPPSFGGTHVQGFTVTSQTSLKTTVVWWHTCPRIHRHISNLSQDHRRLVAHMSKHSPSHLKPLSRPPWFGGTHFQAFTVTSQTSLKTTVVWWHTCPSIHRHISNLSQDHRRLVAHISKYSPSHLRPVSRQPSFGGTHVQAFTVTSQTSLKTTVVWWHTCPSIQRHISHLSQDHRRLVAHMSKDSPSHLKPLSRPPSFGGTHFQAFTVTSQTSLKTAVVWWHTCPSIHRHISNLSQDRRRLVAHVSKHSPSHLKPLSRPPSFGGTHVQAFNVTSQTSLKTTVVWWHTCPRIHRHISNLSQGHRRLVAHMSKDSPSHLKRLSRPPSFGGTHVQAFTVTSQTSLNTTVVWWHTRPRIHRHISNLSQDHRRLVAHMYKHSPSHLKPLSRPPSFGGTHVQGFTVTSQTSLKITVVWWHTCPRIHRHISNLSQDHRRLVAHMSKDAPSHLKPLSSPPSFGGTHVQGFTVTSQTSLKTTVVWWHTCPRIHRHISNLSQDHRRLVAHMSKDSPSHLKPPSRPPSFGGTHIQAFNVTSQTSLKTTVVWCHTYPCIHRHISNLSQDHRRLVAHISKHSPSHLKPLSRPPSVGDTHIQAFTITYQTSLKTTVVWWHTYPSIHRHISNLSQDHRRLVAHISKPSPSHLKPLSRPPSFGGTHVQAFTVTSQTSLKTTVVWWHTYPSIHSHISNLSLKTTVVWWHTYPSIHRHISNLSQDHRRLVAHMSKDSPSHLKPLSRPPSFGGTHIQGFTVTSQTSLKTTVVFWHTYPSINFNMDAFWARLQES